VTHQEVQHPQALSRVVSGQPIALINIHCSLPAGPS
jgi:hypothetical protein